MNTADPMVIEKFKNLPQKLKDILFSEDTTDIIFSTGKENGLTVFQMEELADEIGLVILGINTSESFSQNVLSRLKIDAKKVDKLSQAITEKIFNQILGDLKALEKPSTPIEILQTLKIEEIQKQPVAIPETETIIPPLATKPISQQSKLSEKPMPIQAPIPKTPTPVSPPSQAHIFVKPIQDLPRKPIDQAKTISTAPDIPSISSTKSETSAPSPTKPHVVSWEDILKNKTKEPESHPDAKIALEKALGNTTLAAASSPQKETLQSPPIKTLDNSIDKQTTVSKYSTGKDPYREPIEE